jgi:ABC-type phosphate transport system substrate-binding protein
MSGIRVATLLIALAAADAAAAEKRLLVIVSPTQTITDISLADLRRIYLGQISRWPSRHRIILILPSPSSSEGQLFLKHVIRMADLDYAQYWIGAVFRGQAAAGPMVASSAAEAKRFVASQPNAIAVIGEMAMDNSVRVLTIGAKAPGAPDYPLSW